MTNADEPYTLATAPTRVTDPRCSAAARLDPYWASIFWHPGATADWMSRTDAERDADMGLYELPRVFAERSVEQAMDAMVTARHRAIRLSALAAIGMWRTVTNEQLGAITGSPTIASRRSTDAELLWASGLVARGQKKRRGTSVVLYRPERHCDFEQLSRRISYSDWVALTGGKGWTWGSQFDRHNALATELALRTAEYTDIACVVGESLSGVGLLAGALNTGLSISGTRAADAIFVRWDGMLIAVEVTASVTENFKEKVAKWAQVMAADKTGKLTVLFVECAHPNIAFANGEVHRAIQKTVAKAAHASMATALADVPERMMFARWIDWFPGPGRLTRSFLSLEALRPTGGPHSRWEPVNLLDPFAFPWDGGKPDAEDGVVRQCQSLYGVPYWMRQPPIDYSRVIRERAGVTVTPKLPYSRNYQPRNAE